MSAEPQSITRPADAFRGGHLVTSDFSEFEVRIGVAAGDLPDLRLEPGRIETIDVAAAAAAAAREAGAPAAPPPPRSALELQLLEEARKCAANDRAQAPRRELIAAALREADRQLAWRDHAEAQVEHLLRAAKTARATHRGLVALNAELVAYLAEQFGCALTSQAVLERIRRERPTLLQAIAATAAEAPRG